MKVAKTVTTQYSVDFGTINFSAAEIGDAMLKLTEAGVEVEKCTLSVDERRAVLTSRKTTYYDDSTLNRMEG